MNNHQIEALTKANDELSKAITKLDNIITGKLTGVESKLEALYLVEDAQAKLAAMLEGAKQAAH